MQHSSGFGRTVWFAALCLFTIRLSTAQVSTGSIAGQVTDQSNAVVPSITVSTDQRRHASPEKRCNRKRWQLSLPIGGSRVLSDSRRDAGFQDL